MRAGRMDRLITIEQKTPERTPLGDVTETWGTLATVWAEVVPTSGREYFSAQSEQRVASKLTRFRIRYLAAAAQDTQLRVLYDSQTYDIQHIAEIGRRVGLDLVGEAVGQS